MKNKIAAVIAFLLACIVPGGFIALGIAFAVKYFKSKKAKEPK